MDMLPVLSPSTQILFRTAYGIAIFCTILWTLFPGRWFFRGAKWGGYGDNSLRSELLQNPFVQTLITGLWIASAISLIRGYHTVTFAAINLAICWYYFVHMRWNSLLRGMGAPGFFCYWTGAAVFLLETGRHLDSSGRILAIALLVLQVDYALIQLCAGSYKSVCGYSRNTGMQLGLANPFWGHHWRFYKKWNPANPIFRFLNQASFRVQIVAGILMLFPPTRWIGALMIALSFLFVFTQIRLGFLLPKVMMCGLLFVPAGSRFDEWLAGLMPLATPSVSLPQLPEWTVLGTVAFLVIYLCLLPVAKFCQWFNFLEGKSLSPRLQNFLDKWCSAFGIIIWRVFSVDVIDFFVRIYLVDADGREDEYTHFGKVNTRTRGRYIQVAESIALTCVFTTLKYHPANSELFQDKLVRYARTLPCPEGGVLRFAYFSINYEGEQFEFEQTASFDVEPFEGSVRQTGETAEVLSESPVSACATPGSYLAANT